MQYREIQLCENFVINTSSMTTKTDPLNLNKNSIGSNPAVVGTTPCFETEWPKSGNAKLVIICTAAAGTSPTVTPKLRAVLTAADGTTFDAIINAALTAITAVGTQVYDLQNLPKNLYLDFGALGGSVSPSLTVTAFVITG